ncbi:MAG: penicillin-binding protein 1A, partial [Ramlibacter sp.]
MPPFLARVSTWTADHLNSLWALARRNPWRTSLILPALVLLYVLVLLPFTPSISDLRKAKSEVPSVVMSVDDA